MKISFDILKKSLVKETFIYTATDMVGKAMSFILLMLISYYLPPDELGIATNFTVLTQLVVLLSGLAIVNSLPYFFYEQNDQENLSMVSNLLFICLSLCLSVGIIFLLFNDYIYDHLQLDVHIQCYSIVFVFCNLVSQTDLLLFRLENRPKQFAVLQIIQILLHATIVLLFVIGFKKGGLGKIYAEVIVFLIMGAIHLGILVKKGYLRSRVNFLWIKKLLKFGIPLLPHSISFWLKSGMDKVFITTYCGLQYNGLYSMAISIGALYTMLVQSFFNAYTPYLQKKLTEFDGPGEFWNEKKAIVRRTYQIYLLFFFVGILSIGGAWFIFNYLIDPKYLQAFKFMPFIIFASFIYTFYNFTIQFIYKAKKTLIMGCITFTGSLIQMLLSYFLIKTYGVMGAVYSLLIGNTLITLGIFIYSNIVYKMPWITVNK